MCLHPQGDFYTSRTFEESSSCDLLELSKNNSSIPTQYYVTWNPDENQIDEKDDYASLGLDDFFIFDLMLLSVLPPLSSLTVQIYVLIGHIIAVQIGQEATYQLGRLAKQWKQPAVPLPVVMVSLYCIVLNIFIDTKNSHITLFW